MSRILRYEVPVDDQWHQLHTRLPLHVGCRQIDVVEFWSWEPEAIPVYTEYRVFGTGQPVDDPAEYVGTVIEPGGHLVWHLMRRAT